MLATALAAVAISVEFCIVIGVFLSFVLYVPRAAPGADHAVERTAEDEVGGNGTRNRHATELLLYQLEGELFFGAEPELNKHFATIEQAAAGPVRAVILALERAEPRCGLPQPAPDVGANLTAPERSGLSVRRRPRLEERPREYRPGSTNRDAANFR